MGRLLHAATVGTIKGNYIDDYTFSLDFMRVVMYHKDMENIKNLLNTKGDLIEQLCSELAMNFDCPAKQIIGVYCAKMGITPEEWDKVATYCRVAMPNWPTARR